MAVTLAFSVHNFVDKIGSYAGFAAILGLALFALLLFAQARELKRLREWGAGAHDRIGELERRLAAALELARRAGTTPRTAGPTTAAGSPPAPPVRGPVPARTSSPTRLPLLPAAPVGLGGPALGSATTAIALPARPPGAAAPPLADEVVAAPVAAVPQPPATPAPATAAAQAPTATPATVVEPPAATNGHGETPPDAPPPPARRIQPPPARPGARPASASAAGGARRPARTPARPGGQRPAAAPLRARTASATPRGAGPPVEPVHARRRTLALVGGLLALVLVVGIVLIVATSGGGSGSASQTSAGTTPGHTTATHPHRSSSTTGAAAPAHNHIQVAVLNGTPVPGLANTVANTLAGAGFVRGQVGNASSQNRSVTVVSYLGGQEAAAAEVAKTLSLQSDAVQPIDADTEASACGGGGGTCAPVVVTVGADREH